MKGLIMVSILALGTASAAAEETTMNEAQLDGLLTGNTVYIAVPPGGPGGPNGGVAPFKFGADGSAAAKLPAGMTLVGKWRLDGDKYCADWDNGPQNSCTKIVKSAEGMKMFDAAKNEPRGVINSIAPGNPENL
ncbi:MAG: hypothetical protein AAGF28_02660 [Pseudomonadota bacterium]